MAASPNEPAAFQPLDDFSVHLADLRQRIDELNLPDATYAAIGITADEYIISVINDNEATTIKHTARNHDRHQEVIDWLREHTAATNTKIIAAAILGGPSAHTLGSRLWLEEDIVPYPQPDLTDITEHTVQEAARRICSCFDEVNLVKVPLSPDNEVSVAYLTRLDDYRTTIKNGAWKHLEQEAEQFRRQGNRLLFINATPQGGGVALMRHALIRFYRLLDIDAHWHVMRPDSDVFHITKNKFHNVLQGVAPDGVELTAHDQDIFRSWSQENADVLHDAIAKATVIVIDDPQPSGLIPFIKDHNPAAHVIYRSHIHLDNELLALADEPAYHTWQFIWGNAKPAELFISHPVREFIPREVFEKTLTMPATTDPLDGLNKQLSDAQQEYYLKLFNKILLEHNQEPLDRQRPYLIQVARFDPSKGIPDVIEAYTLLREKLGDTSAPQLVITGQGSIDDPDGIPVYNMVMQLLQQPRYRKVARDIKVVRLHHNDQILNALLRGSYAALQLSYKEGFEVKVTEGVHKGKPVIAYRAGGIPLQIKHGETGFLVDVGDCETVAEHLHQLLTDTELCEKMSRQAQEQLNPHYFTIYNALKWLFLANALTSGDPPPGRCQAVGDLIGGIAADGTPHHS